MSERDCTPTPERAGDAEMVLRWSPVAFVLMSAVVAMGCLSLWVAVSPLINAVKQRGPVALVDPDALVRLLGVLVLSVPIALIMREFGWMLVSLSLSARVSVEPHGVRWNDRHIPWHEVEAVLDKTTIGGLYLPQPYATLVLSDGTCLRLPRSMKGFKGCVRMVRERTPNQQVTLRLSDHE